jgi:hypothetical protein
MTACEVVTVLREWPAAPPGLAAALLGDDEVNDRVLLELHRVDIGTLFA